MRFLRKILVFLAFLILYTGNIAASENVPQRFLIIHSYSSGCKWTDHIHGGILDELRNQDPTIRFNVEYMDSQYLYDHEFEQNLYSLYRKKYEDTHFDGIIVSDNNAVNFILVYGEELFKDVPVVACGVNHLTWRLADSHIDSFILEQPDMVRSVEDMKSIFPEMETLNFIFSSRNRLLNTNSDVLNEMRDVNRMVDVRVFDNGLNNRIIEELSMTDGTNNVIFLSPILHHRTERPSIATLLKEECPPFVICRYL